MTISLKANAAGTQGEILLNGSTVETFNQNLAQFSGVVESLVGGFKFPDDTVQTTAAVSGVYESGQVIQKLVFDGGSFSNLSATALYNIIDTLKTITPKSTNSTLFVEALTQAAGTAPAAGVNVTRSARLYEGSTATPIGGVANVAAVSGAGTGIAPSGSLVCQAILPNTALTPRSFGLGGFVAGSGAVANYGSIILSITEIKN